MTRHHARPTRPASALLVLLLLGAGIAALPAASATSYPGATYTCHYSGTVTTDGCPYGTVTPGSRIAFHNDDAILHRAQAEDATGLILYSACLAAGAHDAGFLAPTGPFTITWYSSCAPTIPDKVVLGAGVRRIVVDPEPCVREPAASGGDRICVGDPPYDPRPDCAGVTRHYRDGSTLYAIVCADPGDRDAYGCVGTTHPSGQDQGGLFAVQSSAATSSFSSGGHYVEDCGGIDGGCPGTWREWGTYGATGEGTYWRQPAGRTWSVDSAACLAVS